MTDDLAEDFGDGEDVCFDPKVADIVLAKDLNRLSVQERNMVLDDVHGVREFNHEQLPSKLMQSLEQMDKALETIQSKDAYRKAVALSSRYVLHDKELRFRFLWADEFDVQKAAQRFVNYLDFYHEYFGTVALMRPIRFDDLNKEEQNILREGSIQLLPCRDRTERRILARIGVMGRPGESQYSPSLMRVNSYMMQVLSNDEPTQKYGCVMVFHSSYNDNEVRDNDAETDFLREPNIKGKIRKFISSFPVRVAAIHFCFPRTLKYRLAASALSLIAPSILRIRVRVHLGSSMECRYALMTYGIPGDQFPITSSGRIKTINHQRWIRFRQEKEDNMQMGSPPFNGLDCPLGTDVCIGNAGNSTVFFRNTRGDLFYRELLKTNFNDYQEADVTGKTRVTWEVLKALQEAGGRILNRDRRGWWTIASADKSREKIAHDFRGIRKKNVMTKQKQQQVTEAPPQSYKPSTPDR